MRRKEFSTYQQSSDFYIRVIAGTDSLRATWFHSLFFSIVHLFGGINSTFIIPIRI
ncbi:MAG: hypothetical protein KDC12_05405 [Flavobacteriales bacterium]|nr:hypothetical protein [Flavobacteriales bacterium]